MPAYGGTRHILQLTTFAAALVLGFIPETFNGLSILAILLAGTVFLLQPGALVRFRRRPIVRWSNRPFSAATEQPRPIWHRGCHSLFRRDQPAVSR